MALDNTGAQALRSFIHRIERLNEEAAAIAADKKEVFAEAKGTGFDTKIMNIVIRVRKMETAKWEEQCTLVEIYLAAANAPDEVIAAAKEALRPEGEAPVEATADGEGAAPEADDIIDPHLRAEFDELKVRERAPADIPEPATPPEGGWFVPPTPAPPMVEQ